MESLQTMDNTPTQPTSIRIEGMPKLWQIITSMTVIAGVVVTAGALLLNKSFESMESKLTVTISDKLSPVNQRLADLRAVATLLVSKTTMTDQEREGFNKLLSRVQPDDIKKLVAKNVNKTYQRRSLKSMIDNNEVKETNRITGLTWNGGHPAQVRYIEPLKPDLDLDQIEFFSEGERGCWSEMLDADGAFGDATVQVCASHMDPEGRLELVIVSNPNGI